MGKRRGLSVINVPTGPKAAAAGSPSSSSAAVQQLVEEGPEDSASNVGDAASGSTTLVMAPGGAAAVMAGGGGGDIMCTACELPTTMSESQQYGKNPFVRRCNGCCASYRWRMAENK